MFDRVDTALLRSLEQDGRQSFAELGRQVGLSKTPCWQRVQALERAGVIRGYHAELDPQKLGLQVHAFVHATIDATKHDEFEAAVMRHPSILQCFTTAGEADYLLHVLVPDISALDTLLREGIARMPGVQRSVTTVCLKTIKRRSAISDCLR
ncbi:MAG: Lrp/AsnC family transcriptional regulator [Pseudomonadota bacterium]|jgi:Transcriptional regulators|nr:MAG: Lrp/AsnC family transcriptional regulator [Pseudomonadota bacterium]